MSGHLHLLNEYQPPKKHDHLDIVFNKHYVLRYTDPRRFGAICWIEDDFNVHPLIASLGIEPLTDAFTAEYLYQATRRRKQVIKACIMNNKIVVGVGNIYAAESLFQARIHPLIPACDLTMTQCSALVGAIKKILEKAIRAGGTTLKDFMNSEGKPGYFSQQLLVYGQEGNVCTRCQKNKLQRILIAGRATVFCPSCQKT
jgi:formamidopyrimidine-DNA glycosylase